MRIGELARLTGTPPENIRFYEREGLLQAPERSRNNYRRYGPAHVERLHLIRNYRASGIGLDDVRRLLGWAHEGFLEPELLRLCRGTHGATDPGERAPARIGLARCGFRGWTGSRWLVSIAWSYN